MISITIWKWLIPLSQVVGKWLATWPMPRKRSSSADNVMHASLGKFNVRQGGFGGGGQRDVEGRHGGWGDGVKQVGRMVAIVIIMC